MKVATLHAAKIPTSVDFFKHVENRNEVALATKLSPVVNPGNIIDLFLQNFYSYTYLLNKVLCVYLRFPTIDSKLHERT
jgi:hypothetical protein